MRRWARGVHEGRGWHRDHVHPADILPVLDSCEIASGIHEDNNNNGVPDICECAADLSGDGVVGVDDLLLVIAGWGDPYDVDDLLEVIQAWGPCEN